MREIKFRIWDAKHKEFTKSLLQFEMDGSLKAEPNGILMQFTGLKDKNGKEIYEGDIVKSDSHIAEVEIVEGLLKPFWEVEHADDVGIDYRLSREWEIIGNIYENPELLK